MLKQSADYADNKIVSYFAWKMEVLWLKPTADRRPRLAHDSSGSTCILSGAQGGYLQTVRKLLVKYQRAGAVKQQQIFVMMMHAFMQELCGYPPTSYLVTPAAYSTPAVGSSPACGADSICCKPDTVLLYHL